jgi:ketol-acid reductoisomerase
MNRIISDTAEYGCYLFDHACKPLLCDYVDALDKSVIGNAFMERSENEVHTDRSRSAKAEHIDNHKLIAVNKAIRNHPIEKIGEKLRDPMIAMKSI